MSKRPSFQFYPADWLSNTNLRRCTHEEKGVWVDLMCLLHDSEEYGILRWSLEEISLAISCDVSILISLIKKGVLKGADKDTLSPSFTTTFVQRHGPHVTKELIHCHMGPIWYSSRMVRDEFIRKRRADGGSKALEHPSVPKKKTKKDGDKDTNKDTDKDTFSPSFGCTTSTSSSSSSSLKKKQQQKRLSHEKNQTRIVTPEKIYTGPPMYDPFTDEQYEQEDLEEFALGILGNGLAIEN